MNSTTHILKTRRGIIRLPAYIPVTTFGDKYPLDRLVQPYLPRLAQGMMVSFHYARQMATMPNLPLFVDSGGFASLFGHTDVISEGQLGVLKTMRDDTVDTIHPKDVLELQEAIAEVAFTLDFPIPPNMDTRDASFRQDLTIANALWALENRRRKDLVLFACIQAWNVESARESARIYAQHAFDGVAIGGLVPRVHDMPNVLKIVEAVRSEIGDCPLHVFGLGNPKIVEQLFDAGTDSVDSSSYVKLAADGRSWSNPDLRLEDASITDRLHLALCNLASAAGASLPLSTSRLTFSTSSLDIQSQALNG